MSTRNKKVIQDVAFRVVSCFTDTRPCSSGNVVTPREILRQTNTYNISIVILFDRLFLTCWFLMIFSRVSIRRTDDLDFWRAGHARPRRKSR